MKNSKGNKVVIAYKIVRYNYNVKNDLGALVCAFADKQSAEDYKLILLDKSKLDIQAWIYSIEPVFEYFNFIDFLTSGSAAEKVEGK